MNFRNLAVAAATAFAVAGCATKPMTDKEIAEAERVRSESFDRLGKSVTTAPSGIKRRLQMPWKVLWEGPTGQFVRDAQYELCRARGTCKGTGNEAEDKAAPQPKK